jgi:putative transposase
MPNYRRHRGGNLYFFTMVTFERRHLFHVQRNRDLLRECMEATKGEHPWETVAIVLLPEHLHTIWRMQIGRAHV